MKGQGKSTVESKMMLRVPLLTTFSSDQKINHFLKWNIHTKKRLIEVPLRIKIYFIILLSSIYVCNLKAQAPNEFPSNEQEAQAAYEYRIERKYLNGRYIPQDMLDACRELTRLSEPKALEKFKMATEETISTKLHFGLGKWISKNWSFLNGSRYSHYLKEMGVGHPDDMIRFTLIIWHRQLNDSELHIKELAEHYSILRKANWEAKKALREVIYEGPGKE